MWKYLDNNRSNRDFNSIDTSHSLDDKCVNTINTLKAINSSEKQHT